MHNRIREARCAKGVSQVGLAKLVSTTRAQIHRLEHGKRGLSLEWMARIAQALDVKIADLLPCEQIEPASTAEAIANVSARLSDRDQRIVLSVAKALSEVGDAIAPACHKALSGPLVAVSTDEP